MTLAVFDVLLLLALVAAGGLAFSRKRVGSAICRSESSSLSAATAPIPSGFVTRSARPTRSCDSGR